MNIETFKDIVEAKKALSTAIEGIRSCVVDIDFKLYHDYMEKLNHARGLLQNIVYIEEPRVRL